MVLSDDELLDYHEKPRPGKVSISLTKPCTTQRDLSMAYTPGVARPSGVIARDPAAVFRFTNKGNLVAVISNGTAVLGLGNIGPLAAKPVMEGKATLFERFADVDVFDLEVDAADPDDFVRVVRALEPTFGGIALEDIRAPECFYIEDTLQREMRIPVFHDDQHGTAVVVAAALLNAVELAGKRLADVTVVVCGAGAAGIASAELCVRMGLLREQIVLVDTIGVVHSKRLDTLTPQKARFAALTDRRTLADALRGADVFVGVSAPNVLTDAMLRSMARSPIVFALSNPEPEIGYAEARLARSDAIVATGRSDHPNQVNNVLAFPSIFRGALDVRARAITDDMKLAAVRALADLARDEVLDVVLEAYDLRQLSFGPEYFIPKVFDPRLLPSVALRVAEAATRSGVAQRPLLDAAAYLTAVERVAAASAM